MNQQTQELHNRYKSDPAIIAINEEIARLYSVAIPTFIMDETGNVSVATFNGEEFKKALENAKQVLAEYVAVNYPELIFKEKPNSDDTGINGGGANAQKAIDQMVGDFVLSQSGANTKEKLSALLDRFKNEASELFNLPLNEQNASGGNESH